MIKLVAIDIDGTLIDSNHVISKENKDAIKEAMDKGIKVILCTGRMVSSAYDHAITLKINCPMVFMNGSLVKNPFNEETVSSITIGEEKANEIMDILEEYKVIPNFYTEYTMYISQDLERYKKYFSSEKTDEKYSIVEVKNFKEAREVIKKEKNFYKFIFFPKEKNEIIKEKLRKVKGLEVCSSSKDNIELTGKGATKGNAVVILGKYFSIERDEIMVIGDSENDLSMFLEVKNSVAMGNAIDTIKKIAKHITLSNEESGVGKAIRKWVL